MKSNVINPSHPHQIPIEGSGTLAIIGENNQRVVIMASGLSLWGGEGIKEFAKNSIFTYSVDGSGVIIFEYNLRGRLRNPQRLLKSLRNKLMGAINAQESELAFQDEMNQLDHEMSMAEHHPNRYGYGGDQRELTGQEQEEEDRKLAMFCPTDE